tara:strand:- start:147 stop:386 length:240 start_codon:yes stop_codon:yes gene_type:complete
MATLKIAQAASTKAPRRIGTGSIYFASAGKTVVIQAGPKLEILAESDLGDPSLATAAVANGRIFLKGKAFLYAIGNKKS